MSDHDQISPYHINIESSKLIMIILKNSCLEIISWSSAKFSELKLKELYGKQRG